jgi:hypothetical protein
VAALPPCVFGLEACPGAHHWARQFEVHSHTVRLMAPKLVAPYRMSGARGKNDAADAAAICSALRLIQVLHLRCARPVSIAPTPPRPAWRCACGQTLQYAPLVPSSKTAPLKQARPDL